MQYTPKHNRLYLAIRTNHNHIKTTLLSFFINVHINGKTETLEFPCEFELVYEVGHIADCIEKGLLSSPVITKELSMAAIAALEKVKEKW